MALPEWLWDKTIAVYDLETDPIETTKIYMSGVGILTVGSVGDYTYTPSRVFTGVWAPYSTGSMLEAVALINSCDYRAGFNSVGFDDMEVRKHLGVIFTNQHLDGLIISKLIFSKDDLFAMDPKLGVDKALWGSYKLKAFGQRLGDFKLDFEDFSEMTHEMATYCNRDVDLTAHLLMFLLEHESCPLQAVIDIEHAAAAIIAEQTFFGFYLDIDKTRALNTKLLREKGELHRELSAIFTPRWLRDGPEKSYKKPSQTRKFLPNHNYKPLLGTP